MSQAPQRPQSSPAARAAIAVAVTAAALAVAVFLVGHAAYDWVKAIHVIAIISWMAGMLYLPRLFVYHCAAAKGSDLSETLKLMEARLLRIIINPAMVLAWASGAWLVWQSGYWSAHWFHGKLLLVILLSGAHGVFSSSVRAFAEDRNVRSERTWRILNEVPALLMIGIVVLVIVKPF